MSITQNLDTEIPTSTKPTKQTMTRRQLLSRASALGAGFVVGSGFIASNNAAWAQEVAKIQPKTFATLVQMARDIYPHDRVPDENYVIAVRGYDNEDSVQMIEQGIDALNTAAREAGFDDYMDIGWERERVVVLEAIESSDFFQTIRAKLVTGLYNQKSIWPIFGYEGPSFMQGGYINRGFNDINWL